jgi:hypothetical protein
MHIQSEVNHIFRILMLLLHVSALYERHLQGAQIILIKLCVRCFISAELSEGREWIPSVCSQSVGSGYRLCVVSVASKWKYACFSLGEGNIFASF